MATELGLNEIGSQKWVVVLTAGDKHIPHHLTPPATLLNLSLEIHSVIVGKTRALKQYI